jgi:carboxypeptidase PM20D1
MRRLFRLIRRIALVVTVAAVALAGVLFANVLSHDSRQIAVTALAPTPVDATAAAGRLAAAIRFRTMADADDPEASAGAFDALHAHIAASFPAFHAVAKREVIGRHALLYTWEGSDPAAPPAAWLAHQDVVPIAPGTEADWLAAPFEGVVRDGYIWGRGAWDDKGNLFAMLEAADALAQAGVRPKHTLYLAFGDDEEVGGRRGAVEIARTLNARGVRLGYVLDEGLLITDGILKGIDRKVALIGVAEKGFATLALTATATPGHSSLPPRHTATGVDSAALTRNIARPFPAALGGTARQMFDVLAPEMQFTGRLVLSNLWLFEPLVTYQLAQSPTTDAMLRTTMAPTIFNAGNKDNVLPARAEAIVNFRLLPGDSGEALLARVRAIVGDRVTVTARPGNTDPPPVTSPDSAAYRALNRTIREVFPGVVVAPGLMVATTDSRHYAGLTDAIFRFSPVIATQEDLTRFHGTNERISVANYADMIRFYRRLIEAPAP